MAQAFIGDTEHPIEGKEDVIQLNEIMIPPGMLKHLGILTEDLKEEDLRKILKERYDVDSRKKLTRGQADTWIIELEDAKRATTPATKKASTPAQSTRRINKKVPDESQLVELLDKADEELAMEIEDVGLYPDMVLAHYIEYKDRKTGKIQEGVVISAAGIFEAATNEGLRTIDIDFLKVEDKLIARAIVENPRTGARRIGFASRCFNQDKKIEILSTIASRNACKKTLTSESKNKILAKAKKNGLIKKLPVTYSK
ncbi:MAG TPA: hypothetical protein ENI13_02230 [candidate division CPR3 bacterium]|uniref:Uncharacterized protein n=1 Tax=candidate division CPR3 bacterium TaxID=2268181 RepID=A0A7C1T5R8_UNCC3|nr:hypothetical protein [candidate division CPR3 bacterium]